MCKVRTGLETLKRLCVDVYNICRFEVEVQEVHTAHCVLPHIMWLTPFHSESKVLCGVQSALW